jgi:uncharacterized protein (UPF0216 family)
MSEDVFLKQMGVLNRHLASSKMDLSKLLESEEPSVVLKDGSIHSFDVEELRRIAEILPVELYKVLKLPIFIELSSSKYGPGTARVSGRTECIIISKILGKECTGDEMFIYRPDLRKIRNKLKTSTQHLFTTHLGP